MTEAGDVISRRAVTVEWKANWSDEWTAADKVFADLVTAAAEPTMPMARLSYHAGNVFWPDLRAWTEFREQLVAGWFVRIYIAAVDHEEAPELLFIGTIAGLERRIKGDASTTLSVEDQVITAQGMDALLDLVRIDSAWITNDGTTEEEIDVVPVFNDRYERGANTIGNRSTEPIQRAMDNDELAECYVFAGDGEPWTTAQIIEYLLAHAQPRGVIFELGGQTELLETTVGRIALAGQTIRQAINHLIDRRRGVGWRLDYSEGTEIATVTVFSLLDEDVEVGGEIIPASDSIVANYDLGGIAAEDVTKVHSTATAYGTIRVLGERMRSMFTLSFADSTLSIGWTSAEETAYKAGGTASDDVGKDRERATDKYRRVFCAFSPPTDWDWKAGDGAGGSQFPVCPLLDDEGSYDSDRAGPVREWLDARPFLDRLLIAKDAGTDGVKTEFAEPIAIIKTAGTSAAYVLCDRLNDLQLALPSANLRMLDHQLGVELSWNPSHLCALNHWTAPWHSQHAPVIDYEQLIVTVAAEMDQRIRRVVTIEENDPDREIVIQVPEAHAWYVVEGTVIGCTNGALVAHAGGWERWDIDAIDRVAALAQVWYGRERSAVSWVVRDIDQGITVGSLLEQLDGWLAVATPVTEIEWDLVAWQTRVCTNYVEMDFLQ